MAYTKQTWENLPSQTTPINADRLTHIEYGIFDAAATADTAASDASSAISGLADKVDKVEGKGLSTNDFTDALKTKLDNIETGAEVNVQSDWNQSDNSADDYIKNKPTLGTSAYKNSTNVVTDSTDLVESGAVKDLVGWGNKNLWNNNLFTSNAKTTTGVTATLQNDKSLIITGGNTSSGNNVIECGEINLKTGTYTLSGANSGSATEISLQLWTSSGFWYDTGNGVTFTLDADITAKLRVYFTTNAQSLNKHFYPQLEKGSTATSYEPYHASVGDTLRDAEVVEGKNLCPTFKGTTFLGVTYTVDANGVVTGNGTASDNAYITSSFTAKKTSQVYLSGCNSNNSAIHLFAYDETNAGRPWTDASKTARQTADLYNGGTLPFYMEEGNVYTIYIRVRKNATATNQKFYPMVSVVDDTTYEPYYTPLKDVVPNKADNSVIGTVEGANASKAWSVGEHFIKDGAFKEVTQPISSGGTISDSNTVDKPIADCLLGVYKHQINDLSALSWSSQTNFKNTTVNLDSVLPSGKKIVGITPSESWSTDLSVLPLLSINTNQRGVQLLIPPSATPTGKLGLMILYV